MVTATGWTFEQVDEMTLTQLNDLLEYWTDSPPLHVMVAAYFGLKPNASATKSRDQFKPATREEIEAFAAMFGEGL